MKKLFPLIFLVPLLSGCYPDGPDYVQDLDVVYTTHEETYDFDSKNTFAMPDRIVVDVEIDNGDTTYEYMNDIYATPILTQIADNMESYGWERVNVTQNPDVYLTPAGISSTTYFYSYWYDWWYGGYWGWYGWYYPPYYTVSSYTTGTLMMVMSDPNQANDSPINRSPAVWVGAANGLLGYGYDPDRVSDAIDQAFAQSDYLNH